MDNKVRQLYVSAEIQQQLSDGRLAIVSISDEQVAIIGHAAAEKIQQRDAKRVLSYQQPSDTLQEDDPYAEFQIPDDLMW